MEEKSDTLNLKILKKFTNGSLVLIGLLAVLYYGVVALVLPFSDKLKCYDVWKFVFVLAIPLLVFLIIFLRFACLVELHSKNLFAPSENKHEEPLISMNGKKEHTRFKKQIQSRGAVVRKKRATWSACHRY